MVPVGRTVVVDETAFVQEYWVLRHRDTKVDFFVYGCLAGLGVQEGSIFFHDLESAEKWKEEYRQGSSLDAWVVENYFPTRVRVLE